MEVQVPAEAGGPDGVRAAGQVWAGFVFVEAPAKRGVEFAGLLAGLGLLVDDGLDHGADPVPGGVPGRVFLFHLAAPGRIGLAGDEKSRLQAAQLLVDADLQFQALADGVDEKGEQGGGFQGGRLPGGARSGGRLRASVGARRGAGLIPGCRGLRRCALRRAGFRSSGRLLLGFGLRRLTNREGRLGGRLLGHGAPVDGLRQGHGEVAESRDNPKPAMRASDRRLTPGNRADILEPAGGGAGVVGTRGGRRHPMDHTTLQNACRAPLGRNLACWPMTANGCVARAPASGSGRANGEFATPS